MADVEELLFSDTNAWMFQDTKDIIGTSDGFEFFKTLSHEQLLSNAPLDTSLLAQYDTSSLTSSPMSGFSLEVPVSPQSDLLSVGTDSSSEEDYSANGSQEEYTDFSALMSSFQPQASSPETLSPVMTSPSEKKQKKKRKINQSCDSVQFYTGGKFVELCEDDLIKLDSQKMETYIQAIHNEKTLTAAEEKELKRIRRLIKNREYAQSSRNKKKQHVEDMQSQINAVKDENDKLNSRIQQLELENKNLKLQLGKIVQAIAADPEMSSKLKVETAGLNLPASQPATQSPTKRKRSAVLFVFLFSLALFVSPTIFTSSFSGNSFAGHQVTHSTSRVLLDNTNAELPVWTKAVSFLPDQFQEWLHRNYLNDLESDTCLGTITSTDNSSIVKDEPTNQEPCDASLGCIAGHSLYSTEVNSTGL